MQIQTQTGQSTIAAGATPVPLRSGKLADTIISNLHGRYYEQAYNGNVFYAANSAAQATSAALATAYTGLLILNPIGSRVNIALLSVGIAVSVAETAIATHGLITGFSAVGLTSASLTLTGLTKGATFISGTAGSSTGVAASQCSALTGTPVWTHAYRSGFTAATLQSSTDAFIDLHGSIILAPGAYAAIGTLTASTILGHFVWEEVPLP